MQSRMCYDDTAWEKSEEIADTWVRQFFDPSISRPIGNFVIRHHNPDEAVKFDILEKGAFNIALRMTYKIGSAIIRFPLPGATMFPEEKLRYEVATMRYIHDHTTIPVPFVFHWGSKKDCPLEGILEAMYGEMAGVLLQLSKPSLPRIGSLSQIDDFTWEVAHRPISLAMNELVRLGTLPQTRLPSSSTPFHSTSLYLETLADLHIAHLTHQRNDAIDAKLNKRWAAAGFDTGPFKLWGEDFRPSNVLVTNDRRRIASIVDLEFTYAAPVEFSFAPPWWLLLERPEYWPGGLEEWTHLFDRRLRTFLRAMGRCEDDAIQGGRLLNERDRLSGPMRESWDSGDFWIVYAVMRNFAFDLVYWHKIDRRFFGPTDGVEEDAWRQRLGLLDDAEKEEMERLVAQKLQEMETRVLAWDPDPYTVSYGDVIKTLAAKKNCNPEANEGDGVDNLESEVK
ncbi:hypothetical protein ARAM_006099 [Aspergillus rambellii]|uniref:Uncharacterized protein n=1 Tax=Aspergillus rambellii TaxID=308745 RepID=A0A0F8WM42_9EURO|nr:hypothetical protein ARAM_006099 [Aspergillus rambellii]